MSASDADEPCLFTGHRFEVRRVSRTFANGHTITREIIRHPGSVVIVPCVDDEHVCLIHNNRISAGETLIEIPAGTLESGEPPLECARRELLEEAGYQAATLRELTGFYAAPGILDEFMTLFLATGLTPAQQRLEADEEISTRIVSWTEALDLIRTRQIRDSKTIAGLLFAYADRHAWFRN